MAAPVDLVTVHHEGAGSPTTASNCARFAEGGYTYGIGTDGWNRFRDVWSSYATLDYNHVSLDLCLSGDRMDHAVTDHDVDVIAGAVTDARNRGYVTGAPQVRAHQNSPGSSTACPGDRTMAVWDQIVAACTAGATPPKPKPEPPKPPPIEETEMFVMAATGRPARLMTGVQAIGLADVASVNALSAADVKSATLTVRDYDAIMTALTGLYESWKP